MNELNMIKTELSFPQVFSNCEIREWGMLFFNCQNKISHDSNHAIIYPNQIKDLSVVLKEISDFYKNKGIVPRIYHPYINGYLKQNQPYFIDNGFDIEVYEKCQYMILTGENNLPKSTFLHIKRVTTWDENIVTNILIPDEKEYEIEVLKESIKNKDFYLFVGYIDELPVTMASLYYSNYDCVRLDSVETAIHYRNKGCAKELIRYVVEFHKENSESLFYLWTDNPVAEKIYKLAGFTLMPVQYEAWSASQLPTTYLAVEVGALRL